jgi:RNA polymerase sigma factor (sigma-70 family)
MVKAVGNDLAAMIVSASIAAPMFDEAIDRAELVRKLIAIANLTPIQEAVLRRRFFDPETLQEIADDYGVCRERIRQHEQTAMRKIRSPACLMMYRNRWKGKE